MRERWRWRGWADGAEESDEIHDGGELQRKLRWKSCGGCDWLERLGRDGAGGWCGVRGGAECHWGELRELHG